VEVNFIKLKKMLVFLLIVLFVCPGTTHQESPYEKYPFLRGNAPASGPECKCKYTNTCTEQGKLDVLKTVSERDVGTRDC
jgi:hypothetical protein